MKTFTATKKQHYVNKMKAHAKADEIIKGTYWEDGKGCHVGCLVDVKKKGQWHEELEHETGIPKAVGYLFDAIFEGLPNGDAKKFAKTTIQKVPVNTDLSMVVPKFLSWLMKDLEKYTKPRTEQRKALQSVRKLYDRKIAGEVVTNKEFTEAAWAAARAAGWAAGATARAAEAAAGAARAAWAAGAAARAAEVAAEAVAEAAAGAAAEAAAGAAWAAGVAAGADTYKKMAKKLHELLEAA